MLKTVEVMCDMSIAHIFDFDIFNVQCRLSNECCSGLCDMCIQIVCLSYGALLTQQFTKPVALRGLTSHFFQIARWYSNMFLAYFEDEIGGSIDGSCGAGRTTVHSTSVLFSTKIPRTISFGLNSSIISKFQHSIVISACHSFI